MMRIGTDLCNPKRIERAYKRFGVRFLKRVLTELEIEHVTSSKRFFIYRLAGRFAVKEAVAKMLGTGIGKRINFHDIEVAREQDSNEPKLILKKGALARAKELGLSEYKVSISHEDIMVIAVAIAN
jgi:holo-[acyl-carrier protein] synthase